MVGRMAYLRYVQGFGNALDRHARRHADPTVGRALSGSASQGDDQMEFELTDRCKELRERLLAFMDEHVYPAEHVYDEQIAASGDPHFHPPVMEELKARARDQGLWNLFLPHEHRGPRPPGLTQRRVRAAGRDHGPQPHRARGVQLRGARHRQHGGADPVRHRRAEGAVADAAARRRDPLGVRDDRAGRRQLGRHQHRDADRARRRRVRAQRPQVVDLGRDARALQDHDRDGQDRSRRSDATASSR